MNVRPAVAADVAAIARVHVEAWQTAYRGIIADAFLDALTPATREPIWHRWFASEQSATPGRGLLVAELDDGKVVGFVAHGPARTPPAGYDGEIYAINLASGARGLGLGRAMFQQAKQALFDAGFAAAFVWVLTANPSRGFYEHLGGTLLESTTAEIGDARYEEVSYGWRAA